MNFLCKIAFISKKIKNIKYNVGTTDCWFRIIGGIIVIVILGLIYKSWWSLIGVALLATGILRFCPLYLLFKFTTLKKE